MPYHVRTIAFVPLDPSSLPRPVARPAFGPGACSGGFSFPPIHVEASGLPSSSENPSVNMPCSFRPRPCDSQSVLCKSLLPSPNPRASASGPHAEFRGSITQPVHSLSTLRRPGRPGPRKTRFQPGTTLCWTGFGPVGFSLKGFRFLRSHPLLRHHLSPLRSFLGAPGHVGCAELGVTLGGSIQAWHRARTHLGQPHDRAGRDLRL
jgi:hypothetical protein